MVIFGVEVVVHSKELATGGGRVDKGANVVNIGRGTIPKNGPPPPPPPPPENGN